MPASSLHANLIKRISILKKQFLNFQQNKTLLSKNQDKLRAFKLLVHAEIESYVETAVLEIWSKCDTEWQTRKKVITPLKFLVMFSTSKFEGNDQQLTNEGRITQILTSFKTLVSNNHGIRKKNILLLVVPLGVDYSSIDQAWLATIDSYGSSRGDVAHNSFSIQQPLDRNDEINNLELVLKGIDDLNIALQGLISSRRRPF